MRPLAELVPGRILLASRRGGGRLEEERLMEMRKERLARAGLAVAVTLFLAAAGGRFVVFHPET